MYPEVLIVWPLTRLNHKMSHVERVGGRERQSWSETGKSFYAKQLSSLFQQLCRERVWEYIRGIGRWSNNFQCEKLWKLSNHFTEIVLLKIRVIWRLKWRQYASKIQFISNKTNRQTKPNKKQPKNPTLNVLIFQHVWGRFTTKRVEKWSKECFIFDTDDCKGNWRESPELVSRKGILNVTLQSKFCIDMSYRSLHWGGSDYVFSSKNASSGKKGAPELKCSALFGHS